MFKIGDIVVFTGLYSKNMGDTGTIWKASKLTSNNKSCYNKAGEIWSSKVRKATEDEIKWFEEGITNINQIPEVGASFDFVDEEDSSQNCKEVIKDISTTRNNIVCSTDNYDLSDYVLWLKNNNVRNYKPPVKSQHVGNKVPIDTPFEIGDLKNCKIGNLTPEDHKIIQPWLFSLGYTWKSDNAEKVTFINKPCLYINDTKFGGQLGWSNNSYFDKNNNIEIKKETILNYIKQLNTNKNEQINKRTEIKPVNRRVTGRSISIPTIAGSITSASRLIGNKASGKCIKSHFRSFKISENIITC